MSTTLKLSTNAVKPSDLLGIARICEITNRFLFIVGQGGAGKTTVVCKTLAPALGREVFYVNLNGQGPQEVIGYGKPSGDEMDFYAPTIWPTLKRVGDRPVLLFLDECNDYDPAVRALLRSLYPASGARMVGPHVLGSNVLVVCATNRRTDGTKSAVEDAPFTERCCKVTLEPDLGDWLAWFTSQPDLMALGSHVPAFLKMGTTAGDMSTAQHFNPPIVQPYDGTPHPCPRTWEAVALAEPFRKSERQAYRSFVRGSVGDAAATTYFAFLQHVDAVPEIKDLRVNYKSFDLGTDPSRQFAVVSACLATATQGIPDVPVAVHSGGFDWLVDILMRCRGDIRTWGALCAQRRGIPLDEHHSSNALLEGAV